LATMALDRWFPTRFAALSDRFVAQNGILLMGTAALAVLLLTGGRVDLLVVLYSINVFLTFSLSQLGMCVHWVRQRGTGGRWKRGLAINGIGLGVTASILVALCAIKFSEGGWVTLMATSAVIGTAVLIRRHYARSVARLRELDAALPDVERDAGAVISRPEPGRGRTAVLLCNGYNGLGVHSFFKLFRMFPNTFDRCVFVHVGVVDAGTFKGAEEIERLRTRTRQEADRYADLCRRCGLDAEVQTAIGHDLMPAIREQVDDVLRRHPAAVVCGGQLAFQRDTVWTHWLHNWVVFALQRFCCRAGVPFVIVPVRV